LTTHYIQVCRKFRKSEVVSNYKMKIKCQQTESGEVKHIYTYLMVPGISNIDGGIDILKDMNYPDEIINSMANQRSIVEID